MAAIGSGDIVGRRYTHAATGTAWEVVRLVPAAGGPAHVVLQRADRSPDTKTVSVSALVPAYGWTRAAAGRAA
jgi:hypothetical protein